jgi:hypothetical protein
MATYLATAALDQLDQAQAELERHLVAGPDGRCLGCRELEPCAARARIEAVFVLYGRLPRRRPGATGMGTRSLKTTDRRSWFGG